MIPERQVHPDLRAMLMANQPFEYAHLIKFERPSRPDSRTGKVSTSGVRYTYLTDASRDIGFDDGSTDLAGNANGSQTYLANKVIKVSDVAETVEAKASNFSIVLNGNGLGAEIGNQSMTITSVSTGIYDISITNTTVDPIYEGFREGDKITLYGGVVGAFNIDSFRAGNIIRIRKIDTDITPGSYTMGFRLDSEEIKSILLNKNLTDYASFINREVFIYKVYQQNGAIVGAPLLLFKGNISNVSFEDSDTGIMVSWGLTSQWGDFAQIKGRITSDEFHRALDQNGNPQPDSALKIEYAYDKGFMHAETSVNILAHYLSPVEKQNVKSKRGFFGIGAKVKVKKYIVNETRDTTLDFQLIAKAIPVHYGVRVTSGIPIFADTLKTDSSTVYVAYALGEGPIGGIYDVYIDGKSLICNNKADSDLRSVQTPTSTVDLICRGRADRGDVLGGSLSTNLNSSVEFYDISNDYVGFQNKNNSSSINAPYYTSYRTYNPPLSTNYTSDGRGVIDGESIGLTSPFSMSLDFFGGSAGQKAASQLVEIAKAGNFKIQSDYWSGSDTSEYWGPNHRLVDTAYIVGKFKIAEGNTTIPSLEFIIRGKVINCYNYDYSYAHSLMAGSDNPDNFLLGDTVTLTQSDTNIVLNANVQIIDKWYFINADGNTEYRFRFSVPPALNYVNGVPTITRFYMQSGANTWTMTTYNYVETSGTVPSTISADVTPTLNAGGTYDIPIVGNIGVGGDTTQGAPILTKVGNTDPILIVGKKGSGSITTVFGPNHINLD